MYTVNTCGGHGVMPPHLQGQMWRVFLQSVPVGGLLTIHSSLYSGTRKSVIFWILKKKKKKKKMWHDPGGGGGGGCMSFASSASWREANSLVQQTALHQFILSSGLTERACPEITEPVGFSYLFSLFKKNRFGSLWATCGLWITSYQSRSFRWCKGWNPSGVLDSDNTSSYQQHWL